MRTLERVNRVVHKHQISQAYSGFEVCHRARVARQNPFGGNMVPALLHTLADASQQALRIAQRHDLQHHVKTERLGLGLGDQRQFGRMRKNCFTDKTDARFK